MAQDGREEANGEKELKNTGKEERTHEMLRYAFLNWHKKTHYFAVRFSDYINVLLNLLKDSFFTV